MTRREWLLLMMVACHAYVSCLRFHQVNAAKKTFKDNSPCRDAITKELTLERLQQGMGLFFVTPPEANLRKQYMPEQSKLLLPRGWSDSLSQRARNQEASFLSSHEVHEVHYACVSELRLIQTRDL